MMGTSIYLSRIKYNGNSAEFRYVVNGDAGAAELSVLCSQVKKYSIIAHGSSCSTGTTT